VSNRARFSTWALSVDAGKARFLVTEVYYYRYIVTWSSKITAGMAKQKITVYRYTCERCDHEWLPRELENEPRVCPKCKSPYWNKPRRVTKKKAA
jgi:Zn finger protein HypA/HybF involved in hydrogenase expression